jgi:hypothetical protein
MKPLKQDTPHKFTYLSAAIGVLLDEGDTYA